METSLNIDDDLMHQPKAEAEGQTADKRIDMEAIYAILSRRYDTGETDVAARHNEHQP